MLTVLTLRVVIAVTKTTIIILGEKKSISDAWTCKNMFLLLKLFIVLVTFYLHGHATSSLHWHPTIVGGCQRVTRVELSSQTSCPKWSLWGIGTGYTEVVHYCVGSHKIWFIILTSVSVMICRFVTFSLPLPSISLAFYYFCVHVTVSCHYYDLAVYVRMQSCVFAIVLVHVYL